MKPEYKCEKHKLDIVCVGCMKAWIARHDKMMGFIKKLSNMSENSAHDCKECYCIACQAKVILQEIGKLK